MSENARVVVPLSAGTIEFSGEPIESSRPSIVKGNRESVVPRQAGRGGTQNLARLHGSVFLESIDRSTKRSESSTRGYPLAREEAGVCVLVIGTRARSDLERSRRFVSRIQVCGPSAMMRRGGSAYGDGRRNNYTRSKWSRKPVKLLLPPVFSFSSRRLFAARSLEKCHLTRE